MTAATFTRGAFVSKIRSTLGPPVGPVRYEFGGNAPPTLDCSGLPWWAARELGKDIPRTSETQFADLEVVEAGDVLPGDLVFFDITPPDGQAQPEHVGVVVGPGRMIDAPHTGENVSEQSFPFPGGKVAGYRRLPFAPDNPGPAPSPPGPTPTPPQSTTTLEVLDVLALSEQDAFFCFVRDAWYRLRTDPIPPTMQATLWYCFHVPGNGSPGQGFGGSIDDVLAWVHDTAIKAGTLRP